MDTHAHVHGHLYEAVGALAEMLGLPRRNTYAHMEFATPDEFRAACIAVRDLHDRQAGRPGGAG